MSVELLRNCAIVHRCPGDGCAVCRWLLVQRAKSPTQPSRIGQTWARRRRKVEPQKVESRPMNGVSYRLDFAVAPDDPSDWFEASELGIHFPRIGIELDGHDFHEKTKEQVTYRNRRDRALASHGWTVFHFSGSELVRHPLRCVDEVMAVGGAALIQMYRAVRQAKAAR